MMKNCFAKLFFINLAVMLLLSGVFVLGAEAAGPSDATLNVFTVGGQDVLGLPGISTGPPPIFPGATLMVEMGDILAGFIGIVMTSTEPAAVISNVSVNQNAWQLADLANYPVQDGDEIKAMVTSQDGTAFLFYKVTVSGVDTTSPKIALNGSSEVRIIAGDSYVDQGAAALDDVDGDISANIVTSGLPVNTSVPGTHILTYNVSDSSGNAAAEITRMVVISPPPHSSGNGGGGGSHIKEEEKEKQGQEGEEGEGSASGEDEDQGEGRVLGAATYRFNNDLERGMSGDDVTELQKRLAEEGIYDGPITGYFGPLTEAGVRVYQEKHGLSSTGIVDFITRLYLNNSSGELSIEELKAIILELQKLLVEKLEQLIQLYKDRIAAL